MFTVLRLLVLASVLLAGWMAWRYVRSRDPRWLARIRWVLVVDLLIALIGLLGLIIQRLMEG
ncbi:hypothetical protein ACTSKR_01830 [Chitinibacteraceae bacterium HSL-7]